MIGGLYGKGKSREEWEGSIGGQKRNLYINSVIMQVAVSLIEKFRMWKELRVSNCWYGRVLICSWFSYFFRLDYLAPGIDRVHLVTHFNLDRL